MKKQFWVPSLLHFLVDFFSAYVMFHLSLSSDLIFALILTYDCLAFLTQPIFGSLLEKSQNMKYWASIGCLTVIFGSIFPNAYAASILLGLGNALFHVCEGKIILDRSEKSSPLGVFISFGSIGLGLGLNLTSNILFWFCFLIFVILSIINCLLSYEKIPYTYQTGKEESPTLILPLILIVLGVFLRGFFGQYNNYSFSQSVEFSGIYLALAVFLGKFIGGFLLDSLSSLWVILISVIVSFVCSFFPSSYASCLLSVINVNLLMALTMEQMRRAMPKYTAYGFGLLAALLLVGYMCGSYLKANSDYQMWLSPLLMLLNGGSLIYVAFLLNKNKRFSMLYNIFRKKDR